MAITVTNRNECSYGNKMIVSGSCVSVATGSVWDTGLGKVDQVFMQPDLGLTWSWSQAAGRVTFTIGAGPLSNVSLLAIGFP